VRAEFRGNLVLPFRYVLDLDCDAQAGTVTWTYVEGEMVKDSTGGWRFVADAGGTRVDYEVSLRIDAPVRASCCARSPTACSRCPCPRCLRLSSARSDGEASQVAGVRGRLVHQACEAAVSLDGSQQVGGHARVGRPIDLATAVGAQKHERRLRHVGQAVLAQDLDLPRAIQALDLAAVQASSLPGSR